MRCRNNISYCSPCFLSSQHIESDTHLRFARDESNFSALDDMIKTGPNMDRFLTDVIKYHKLHVREGLEQRLVT